MMLAAVAVTSAALGYGLGRLRLIDKLDRRTWRRIMFGPDKGERPIGRLDAMAWTLLHPVSVAQALPWSPFYKPPKPRPSIDALDLMPKERASDRADS